MNRARSANSNDPSIASACRSAAVTRSTVAVAIVAGSFAAIVTSGCTPQSVASTSPVEAAAPAAPRGAGSAASDLEQLRLDPAEIRDYAKNVHG